MIPGKSRVLEVGKVKGREGKGREIRQLSNDKRSRNFTKKRLTEQGAGGKGVVIEGRLHTAQLRESGWW